MSITLDTNIYVSALEFAGVGARLLGAARARLLDIDLSDAILAELITVLRDDFHWDGYRLHFLQQELWKVCRRVVPKTMIEALTDDPDDNRILECAVAAASECIVTEDKDLLRLKVFEGVPIMRLRDFLAQTRTR